MIHFLRDESGKAQDKEHRSDETERHKREDGGGHELADHDGGGPGDAVPLVGIGGEGQPRREFGRPEQAERHDDASEGAVPPRRTEGRTAG